MLNSIFLNGEWMPVEDAKSVLDRGFIFATAWRVRAGDRRQTVRLDGHLVRLDTPGNRPQESLQHTKWTELVR